MKLPPEYEKLKMEKDVLKGHITLCCTLRHNPERVPEKYLHTENFGPDLRKTIEWYRHLYIKYAPKTLLNKNLRNNLRRN